MEAVSVLVGAITVAYNKYESFEALKTENENFRQSMLAVRDVLQGIHEEGLQSELRRPLEIIEQGINMGKEVMDVCSKKGVKLRVSIFTETYVSKLETAGNKMDRGLSMLAASGVSVHSGKIEGAKRTLRSMKSELLSTSNDVADLLLDVVMRGLRNIPDQVVAQLRDQNVVSSKQDCYDQIREIQQDKDAFRTAKETFDEELLQWVMDISLPESKPSKPRTSTAMSEDIEKLITCPVTLEFMRDPVMIIQSEQTCDRESLCNWLLEHPSKCPVTGQNFGEKLDYKDNLVARQLLMHFVGDDAYQKYDDSEFQRKYTSLWKDPNGNSAKPMLPDEKTIPLPTSTLGISFAGTPPMITKIANNSPFLGDVLIGMAIDTFVMPGGPTYMQLSTNELAKLLNDTSDINGRALTLKNPATTMMTKKPDEIEVTLPSGKLGVTFAGKAAKIVRFTEDSPVRDRMPIGLVIDTLTLEDGASYSGLSIKEFLNILEDNAESSGRTLLLKNPDTRTLSKRQVILPDEKTVAIPCGYLGVTFAGITGARFVDERSMITSLENDSPVKSELRIGMVVDRLFLPDGSTYSGLSVAELVNALKGSSVLEGRQVHLKNPDTMELSSKLVDPKSAGADNLIEDTGIFTAGIKGIASTLSSDGTDVTAPISYDDDDIVVIGGEDICAYEELEKLLFGMNRGQIDWVSAQRRVTSGSHQDAVIVGFRALLLHPRTFKNEQLIKNESEALSMWESAESLGLSDHVAAGNIWAQVVKGLFNSKVTRDFTSGVEYYVYAANDGNASARYNLGLLYQQGQGVAQDFHQARVHFEEAAKKGHAAAQCSVATLYQNGLGGARDVAKADVYFGLAAAQGYPIAK